MSHEQENAVVGRVAREHSESARQVAILDSELQNCREMFTRLVKALGEVDYVVFDGDSWPQELHEAAGWKMADYSFSSADIDGRKLKKLCADIKEAKGKRNRLAAQLKDLGI